MASSDPNNEPEPRELLGDVLDDPERGRERLPYIVGLFESEDRITRVYGAWTCCFLANKLDDDAVDYMVRRLSDRLDETHASLELTATLDYISARHSEQVERILDEMEEEQEDSGHIPLPRVGDFTRSHYYSNDSSRKGVARPRIAGSDQSENPRRTYADREREEREQDELNREREAEREDDTPDSDEEEEGGQRGDSGDEKTPESDAVMGKERTEIAGIATRSRFNKLHILATSKPDRYADIYDALVARRGEEKAVALRLLHQPDIGERPAFAERVKEALQQWNEVDDHEHVVSVLDWGVDPRPWLATVFTGESLAGRDARPLEIGLQEGIRLADAISSGHRKGVVYGGIDAANVIYPGDILASGEGYRLPLLDNVSLMSAFRFHFAPSHCLDPRYAAPEYFSREYGRVDHATDIYQFGAVLYRLFTGEPPFSGEFVDVRKQSLSEHPVPPTQKVDHLPPALDDIVSKAMAKQKLTRYETVEHLQQELAGVMEDTNG